MILTASSASGDSVCEELLEREKHLQYIVQGEYIKLQNYCDAKSAEHYLSLCRVYLCRVEKQDFNLKKASNEPRG